MPNDSYAYEFNSAYVKCVVEQWYHHRLVLELQLLVCGA